MIQIKGKEKRTPGIHLSQLLCLESEKWRENSRGKKKISENWENQHFSGFPGGTTCKEPACQCKRCKRRGFLPWVGKIPWWRAWQPTPVFLPWRIPWTEEPGGLKWFSTHTWHVCIVFSYTVKGIFIDGHSDHSHCKQYLQWTLRICEYWCIHTFVEMELLGQGMCAFKFFVSAILYPCCFAWAFCSCGE